MKKTNILIIIISSVLALAIVFGAVILTRNNDSKERKVENSDSHISTQADTSDDASPEETISTEELENLVAQMLSSPDAETMKQYITADSFDKAQSLADYYVGTKYEVELEYLRDYKGYMLYSYSSESVEGPSQSEGNGVLIIKEESDGYKVCVNSDILTEIQEHFACSGCGGSGAISTGATSTCGICSGTGQQYIPNLYYDAALGWQGGYTGCGGCGGSGHTGAILSTCHTCNGVGLVIE